MLTRLSLGRAAVSVFGMLCFNACATYEIADQVKVLSLSTNLQRGSSVGTVRGEDCTWTYFGYRPDGPPSLSRALLHAKAVVDATGDSSERSDSSVRYIENLNTQPDGSFNAAIIAKNCLTVTGTGYK